MGEDEGTGVGVVSCCTGGGTSGPGSWTASSLKIRGLGTGWKADGDLGSSSTANEALPPSVGRSAVWEAAAGWTSLVSPLDCRSASELSSPMLMLHRSFIPTNISSPMDFLFQSMHSLSMAWTQASLSLCTAPGVVVWSEAGIRKLVTKVWLTSKETVRYSSIVLKVVQQTWNPHGTCKKKKKVLLKAIPICLQILAFSTHLYSFLCVTRVKVSGLLNLHCTLVSPSDKWITVDTGATDVTPSFVGSCRLKGLSVSWPRWSWTSYLEQNRACCERQKQQSLKVPQWAVNLCSYGRKITSITRSRALWLYMVKTLSSSAVFMCRVETYGSREWSAQSVNAIREWTQNKLNECVNTLLMT